MKKTLFCTEIDRSHFALDLIKKMLQDDPNKRISSEEVVKELETIKIEVTLFLKLSQINLRFNWLFFVRLSRKRKNSRNYTRKKIWI